MNQQDSAFVTAWLSHGHGAPHSNLLVALSLAAWQGVLLGSSATWGSPLTLHALHPQLQAVGKWDISLLCWLKNPVVIAETPGDANTLHALCTLEEHQEGGPGSRSPPALNGQFRFSTSGEQMENVTVSAPCMQVCVCLRLMEDAGWSWFYGMRPWGDQASRLK